jgi:hypothetical protein
VAAVAIVAATIAGMLVLMKQESSSTHAAPNRPTAITPVAFVQQPAAKTLAERTADVTLSGTAPPSSDTISYSSFLQALGAKGERDFPAISSAARSGT